MTEHMSYRQANRTRQVIARPNSIFTTDLIGNSPCRIGFQGQINKIKHGPQIVCRILGSDIKLQITSFNLWERGIDPALSLFDSDFGFTD